MRVELKAEIDVSFSDPEKAKAVFIDGDWKDYFWVIDDLENLATDLANAFHNEPQHWKYDHEKQKGWYQKSPEGFGTFIQQDNGSFVMEDETTGKITISYEMELEPDGTFEVTE